MDLQLSRRDGVNRKVLELAVSAAELADRQAVAISVLELVQRN